MRFSFAEGDLVNAEYARKKSEFFLRERGWRFTSSRYTIGGTDNFNSCGKIEIGFD